MYKSLNSVYLSNDKEREACRKRQDKETGKEENGRQAREEMQQRTDE